MLTELLSDQATFTLVVNIVVTGTGISARKEKKGKEETVPMSVRLHCWISRHCSLIG